MAAAPAAPKTDKGAMPKVASYEVSVGELAAVATTAGLVWVNSDASKIAAVQAAIAAEPKAIRVARERPAAVEIDNAPLVLVETKRDLSAMKLPFESA